MAGKQSSLMGEAAGIRLRPFLFVCLTALLNSGGALASSAEALINPEQIRLLDEAIIRYEKLSSEGGWQAMEEGPVLVPGARHEQVRWLRIRLRATGDYDADMGADPLWFDGTLADGVKRFQTRHGLTPSGRVDRLTRQRLNLPAENRVAQLRHAREQLEAGRFTGPGKRVLVNIPEAQVAAIAEGQVQFTHKAIVGQSLAPDS